MFFTQHFNCLSNKQLILEHETLNNSMVSKKSVIYSFKYFDKINWHGM